MLTGIELIGDGVGRIGELRPQVVKVRRPGLAEQVLGVLPEAVLVGRPLAEGYWADEMAYWYRAWRGLGLPDSARWILANEPNHVHSPFHADPEGWEEQARRALEQMGPLHGVYLGGLLPLFQIDWALGERWLGVYDRLAREYGLGRSAHVYNQGAESVDDGLRQLGGARGMVDELGDSGPNGDPGKVERLERVVQRLATSGRVDVAVLFCHEAWTDHEGVEFGLPLEWQARVLGAVASPSVPFPEGGGEMGDRWQEYPVGPGIRAAMEARGDQPRSPELHYQWESPPVVGRFTSRAFGDKGEYVYAPGLGTRFIPFG